MPRTVLGKRAHTGLGSTTATNSSTNKDRSDRGSPDTGSKKWNRFAALREDRQTESTLLSALREEETVTTETLTHWDSDSRATLSLDERFLATVWVEGVRLRALLDTGASDSYVDRAAANQFSKYMQTLEKPVNLHMFDGSLAQGGPLTQCINGNVRLSEKEIGGTQARLFITDLNGADVVLGRRWLREHGGILDLERLELRATESNFERMMETGGRQEIRAVGRPTRRQARRGNGLISHPNNLALPFNRYEQSRNDARETGETAQLFSVLRALSDGNLPEVPNIRKMVDKISQVVPVTYHKFLDLFDPERAKETLPPHRSYDMTILLFDDAKLESAKLYRLSGPEKEALWAILQKELASGRIHRCHHLYGLPAFMVPKPNSPGEYCMVIDYRVVNSSTISDAYPLPLVDSILDTLTSAKFFTKLDLPGAYQLLRMAEGHERFTAFRTEYGMFESMVVRDGLKNAPCPRSISALPHGRTARAHWAGGSGVY